MIETARLILRRWRDTDREPFAAMSRDPEVMAHLGPLMSRDESDAVGSRVNAHIDRHGFGFWALERKSDGLFLGFTGLKRADVGPLAGEIEIAWRLARQAWGQGYAREAAQAALDWGFANTDAGLIFAMTVAANCNSWGLMERLGMVRRPDLDFDHPQLGIDDPLRPHIIYVIER